MNKSITIIGINFYPEDSSTGLYTTQMAEYLAGKGHEVSIVTGFPYYPEWEIREAYVDKPKRIVEKKDNITIYRYKQYVPSNPTFKTRTLHLLDFTFGSIRNIFKVKKTDLVIAVVPFTSTIFLAKVLSWRTKAKMWSHIQDFEVDAILDSGISNNQKGVKKWLFKFLFWIEKKLLDSSDLVSTISYGMLSKLESKTDTPNYFFPNWVDENFIDPSKSIQHPYVQSEKFKVLYSGNIGAKQDWDFFLKIVEHFKEDNTLEFIVVGAGAKKKWLLEQTKHMQNVLHYDPVVYEKLPDLLCSADLHVLFQKNDVIDTVMPSKLLGMMASGVPSVVTGNTASEVATVFEMSNGGYFFDAGSLEDVLEGIRKLAGNASLAEKMGRDARSYITEHFAADKVLFEFEQMVQKLSKINGKKDFYERYYFKGDHTDR